MTLYPLRFEPIFTTNLWGGRRLPEFLGRDVGHTDPVGEAWVLSDVDGRPSRVADGPLAGTTLRDLMAADPARVVGKAPAPGGRFPLLLKFLDARQELSVQVHPNDDQAAKVGPGHLGKTEAWVILDAKPGKSRLYAGFAPGVTADKFRAALAGGRVAECLHGFAPQAGDCVLLEAGTVHAIGADLFLFEVQQTSDVTYRLYDWNRVDAKTGRPRELHVEEGLAVADFRRGPKPPSRPTVAMAHGVWSERLAACRYFTLDRKTGAVPFPVGADGRCRVVVCVEGSGELEWGGSRYPVRAGDTVLLPAEVGAATFHPGGDAVVLECGLPEAPPSRA